MVLTNIMKICAKEGRLTPNALVLCYLIYKIQTVNDEEWERLYRNLLKETCAGLTKRDVTRLIAEGWLAQSGTEIERYEVLPKFTKMLFPMADFESFWREYPHAIEKNGKTFILKSVDAVMCSLLYHDMLLGNRLLHQKAIETIKWAKQHKPDLLNMRIDNFIRSYGWEGIDQMRQAAEVAQPIKVQNYTTDHDW